MSCITVYNKLQEVAHFESDTWADGAIITLGRNPLTNLPFEHIASLSNHHLSIRKLAGDFYIRDEQSSNGTTADGQLMNYALRMHVGVSYQAGPLTIFLEEAPVVSVNPEENADSVFPEPYAFALNLEPQPQVVEQEAELAAVEEPISIPAASEMPPTASEPVLDDDGCIDLEKMAAMKAQLVSADSPSASALPPTQEELALDDDGCIDLEKMAASKAQKASAVASAAAVVAAPAAATQAAPTPVSIAAQAPVKKLPKPFLPVSGIPKEGVPQDFAFKMTTRDGEATIKEGDVLQLRLYSSVACKIILICKDSTGAKTMLYPNRFQPSIEIPANTWVSLPDEKAINYEFAIEGVGVDYIQAIARKSEPASVNRISNKTAKDKAQKPKTKWAYAELELEVVAAGNPS